MKTTVVYDVSLWSLV